MLSVRFIGCGDAFGSGGRLQTCLHLTGGTVNALIDCGASSLVGLKRFGIDRNEIDQILLTHFHADHFGGVPFFMLDAQFVSRRERPLTIAGPPGLATWHTRAMDTAFAGSAATRQRFAFSLREFAIGERNEIGTLAVTPFHVVHDDRAGPCLALRIEAEDKVITYSGDTEWTPALVPAARDADLFICECYTFERAVRAHMSLAILRSHLGEIGAKKIVLTHMSDDMLAHRHEAPFSVAEDGLVVEV